MGGRTTGGSDQDRLGPDVFLVELTEAGLATFEEWREDAAFKRPPFAFRGPWGGHWVAIRGDRCIVQEMTVAIMMGDDIQEIIEHRERHSIVALQTEASTRIEMQKLGIPGEFVPW